MRLEAGETAGDRMEQRSAIAGLGVERRTDNAFGGNFVIIITFAIGVFHREDNRFAVTAQSDQARKVLAPLDRIDLFVAWRCRAGGVEIERPFLVARVGVIVEVGIGNGYAGRRQHPAFGAVRAFVDLARGVISRDAETVQAKVALGLHAVTGRRDAIFAIDLDAAEIAVNDIEEFIHVPEDLVQLHRVEIDDLGQVKFVLPAGELTQGGGLGIDQNDMAIVAPEQAPHLLGAHGDRVNLPVGDIEEAEDFLVALLTDEGNALAVRRQGDVIDHGRASEDVKRRRVAQGRGRGGRSGGVLGLGASPEDGHRCSGGAQGQNVPAVEFFHLWFPLLPFAGSGRIVFLDEVHSRLHHGDAGGLDRFPVVLPFVGGELNGFVRGF